LETQLSVPQINLEWGWSSFPIKRIIW